MSYTPRETMLPGMSEAVAKAAELKIAKEAFHSNNAGSSIMSINVISLAALVKHMVSGLTKQTSYAIYAAYVSRRRSSPLFDYLTTVLPLLLAVTLLAPQSPTFNAALLCVFGLLFNPTQRALQDKRAAAGVKDLQNKSRGKWLDESDSDEEPALAASTSIPTTRTAVELPSEVVKISGVDSSRGQRRHGETDATQRLSRESTTEESRLDVLPTPEMLANGTMLKEQTKYPGNPRRSKKTDSATRLPFLSVYRAHMMVMTIHCILAVDFPIFPRWLGKCEDFGTSLMDVGVGSFVFSLGIVSTHTFMKNQSFLQSAWRSLRRSGAVLTLGLVRVLMVKGVDYHEHVTEYGVHWNFFFTLGLLPFLGALVYPLRQRGVSWTVLAVLVTIWHQFFISFTPLQAWVMSPDRIGLIEANKEGLTSLPGYFAIYLLGLSTGQHILRATAVGKLERSIGRKPNTQAEERWKKRRTELALELFGYAVAWWVILAGFRLGGEGVSRRLANLPYVVWTAAYNSSFLLGYLLIESIILSPNPVGPACPKLLEAINKNGLVIFLAANLLTGAVNLSMITIYAKWYIAMSVLLLYSAGVSALAWTLRKWRIKL